MTETPTEIVNFDGIHANKCICGTDFAFDFTWKDSAKNVIDPSIYSMKMQVRKRAGSDLICELSTDNGRIFYDSNMTINLAIDASDTLLLTPGKYIYDIILENLLTGKFLIFVKGQFWIEQGVTV